jgi:dihydroorotate dehydrogenase
MLSLLKLLPPEKAHDFSLWALKQGLGPKAAPDDPLLHVSLLGKTFLNPIGLASGAEKKAEALTGWTRMGFGFVEAGTVTLEPRAGNPRPRVWRMQDGRSLVNWMGLPGDGLAPFVSNLKAFSRMPERKKLILGVSMAAPSGAAEEFAALAAACAPLADYLTLNASCPNVAHEVGHDPAHAVSLQIRAAVRAAGGCPLLLKLGPTRDREVLKLMVGAAMDAGAAGIVATNTMPADKRAFLSGEKIVWPEHQGSPVGGYSGPLLLETTCWMIAEIRRLVGPAVPVMGVGGIQSGADALRVSQAGADVIQVYTGLVYKGPTLLTEIKEALLKKTSARWSL